MNLDLSVFNFTNGFAKKSGILDFFAVFCASYLGIFLVAGLAIFSLIYQKADFFIYPLAAALFARFFINESVYFFYKRKRPSKILPIIPLIKNPNHPSFPSSHTAFFFALSFTLFLFNPYLSLFFILASFLIAVARVFAGVHWPSDILGGILSGYLSFLAVSLAV